jgi:putative FmdB family regulatory protein
MPTYEYECLNCGLHFDVFQKMSDPHLEKCIECQGSVRRVISGGSGLIFKGSGFYITDYAKGENKSSKSKAATGTKKTKTSTKTTSAKPAKEIASKK